jgi:hypothetical protein
VVPRNFLNLIAVKLDTFENKVVKFEAGKKAFWAQPKVEINQFQSSQLVSGFQVKGVPGAVINEL